MKKIILLTLALIFSSLGSALGVRANIGVDAYNAMCKSLSPIINIKVGTISIIFNSLFIFIELMILKKDFKLRKFLSFLLVFMNGNLINLFYYNLFIYIPIDLYLTNVVLIVVSNVINGAALAMLIDVDLVVYPMGSCLNTISTKLGLSYAFSRRAVDVFCIVVVLVLYFFFNGELTLREGTILAFLIFGPCVDYFKKFFKKHIKELSDPE